MDRTTKNALPLNRMGLCKIGLFDPALDFLSSGSSPSNVISSISKSCRTCSMNNVLLEAFKTQPWKRGHPFSMAINANTKTVARSVIPCQLHLKPQPFRDSCRESRILNKPLWRLTYFRTRLIQQAFRCCLCTSWLVTGASR